MASRALIDQWAGSQKRPHIAVSTVRPASNRRGYRCRFRGVGQGDEEPLVDFAVRYGGQ
jgi:hypothetical protein